MATKRITSLTREQEAEIPNFIAKWIQKAAEPTYLSSSLTFP